MTTGERSKPYWFRTGTYKYKVWSWCAEDWCNYDFETVGNERPFGMRHT